MSLEEELEKTLEEAIGCWTVNKDYNSLPVMAKRIEWTTKRCRDYTRKGKMQELGPELEMLRRQLESMMELVLDAQKRYATIIHNQEVRAINDSESR